MKNTISHLITFLSYLLGFKALEILIRQIGKQIFKSYARKFHALGVESEDKVPASIPDPDKPRGRIDLINKIKTIRQNLPEKVFWANAGAVVALALSVFALSFGYLELLPESTAKEIGTGVKSFFCKLSIERSGAIAILFASTFLWVIYLIPFRHSKLPKIRRGLSFDLLLVVMLDFIVVVLIRVQLIPNSWIKGIEEFEIISVEVAGAAFIGLAVTIVGIVFVIVSTPFLIKKISEHLPAKDLAKMSISGLGHSEVITYVSLEMWELCNGFQSLISPELKRLDRFPRHERSLYLKLYKGKSLSEEEKKQLLKLESKFCGVVSELHRKLKSYRKKEYEKIYLCYELKKQAANQLRIHEREFSHHVLQFSPSIFQMRVDAFIRGVESIKFYTDNWKKDEDICKKEPEKDIQNLVGFQETIEEFFRIRDDIKEKRMRSLMQLIKYDRIHEFVIGMSSITSTSESLKIFTRGLSAIAKKIEPKTQSDSDLEYYIGVFKALLHRSKAHLGIDLLIPLENFYSNSVGSGGKGKKLPSTCNIPNVLGYIKTTNADVLLKKAQEQPNHVYIESLKLIRENIRNGHPAAMKSIFKKFEIQLDNLEKDGQSEIYFLIFGYSKIVRGVLWRFKKDIESKKIKIFVMKEESTEMLDTRFLRFELNDNKPENVRDSFTSSDDFFLRLVNDNDRVVLLAGAEAYDIKHRSLIHTNNYQIRVEKMLKRLKKSTVKHQVWIVAGGYKIYEDFKCPSEEVIFRKEFFSDHYDNVDLYNFSDLRIYPYILTNDDSYEDPSPKGIDRWHPYPSKKRN